MGRKTLHIILIALTLVMMEGCKEDQVVQPPPPPPPYVSSVQLTKADSSLTEIWLKLKFTDGSLPRSYVV